MNNTQKKALQYVSEILKSVDSSAIYMALVDAMTGVGIDNEMRNEIWRRVDKVVYAEINKASEAKEWIDGIISDI